jgi:hypothetical protein
MMKLRKGTYIAVNEDGELIVCNRPMVIVDDAEFGPMWICEEKGCEIWGLVRNLLFDYEGDWRASQHQVVNGKLVPVPSIQRGDKIMVNIGSSEYRRYFSHFDGERVHFFDSGTDEWTSGGFISSVSKDDWRLPTEDEL